MIAYYLLLREDILGEIFLVGVHLQWLEQHALSRYLDWAALVEVWWLAGRVSRLSTGRSGWLSAGAKSRW